MTGIGWVSAMLCRGSQVRFVGSAIKVVFNDLFPPRKYVAPAQGEIWQIGGRFTLEAAQPTRNRFSQALGGVEMTMTAIAHELGIATASKLSLPTATKVSPRWGWWSNTTTPNPRSPYAANGTVA
jgi:hypothetical protein